MNIIQRSSIPIYQQVSTFLLQTYRAKYLLRRISLQTIRRIKSPLLRQLSTKLRQRLIWFADVLRSYLTETVIDLSYADMTTAMVKAEDIDEMSAIHTKYVARLQDQALLSENLKPIHKAVIAMLDLAELYSQQHNDGSLIVDDAAKSKGRSAKGRRKSVMPAVVEQESSDSSDGDDDMPDAVKRPKDAVQTDGLNVVESEFARLLPFVTAGLRSVGRVGAEPVWEMLAERLTWEEK